MKNGYYVAFKKERPKIKEFAQDHPANKEKSRKLNWICLRLKLYPLKHTWLAMPGTSWSLTFWYRPRMVILLLVVFYAIDPWSSWLLCKYLFHLFWISSLSKWALWIQRSFFCIWAEKPNGTEQMLLVWSLYTSFWVLACAGLFQRQRKGFLGFGSVGQKDHAGKKKISLW